MYATKNIDDLRQVLKHCSFNSFVIFDIDNTLIAPITDLGSDHWFGKMFGFIKDDITTAEFKDTKGILLTMFKQLQNRLIVQPTQKETSLILKILQDLNIPVIAVTSRGYDLEKITKEQLNDCGIDFNRKTKIKTNPFVLHQGYRDQPITFASNILYCSGNDKGFCTSLLLSALELAPQHVLMVDDSQENLNAVYQALSANVKAFTALRYGKLDPRITNFKLEDTLDDLIQSLTYTEVRKFGVVILGLLSKYQSDIEYEAEPICDYKNHPHHKHVLVENSVLRSTEDYEQEEKLKLRK